MEFLTLYTILFHIYLKGTEAAVYIAPAYPSVYSPSNPQQQYVKIHHAVQMAPQPPPQVVLTTHGQVHHVVHTAPQPPPQVVLTTHGQAHHVVHTAPQPHPPLLLTTQGQVQYVNNPHPAPQHIIVHHVKQAKTTTTQAPTTTTKKNKGFLAKLKMKFGRK